MGWPKKFIQFQKRFLKRETVIGIISFDFRLHFHLSILNLGVFLPIFGQKLWNILASIQSILLQKTSVRRVLGPIGWDFFIISSWSSPKGVCYVGLVVGVGVGWGATPHPNPVVGDCCRCCRIFDVILWLFFWDFWWNFVYTVWIYRILTDTLHWS